MVFYDVHQLTNYSIPLPDFENIVSWVEYAKSNILYPLQWLLYWAHIRSTNLRLQLNPFIEFMLLILYVKCTGSPVAKD